MSQWQIWKFPHWENCTAWEAAYWLLTAGPEASIRLIDPTNAESWGAGYP